MKDALLLIVGALISIWTSAISFRYFEFRKNLRDAMGELSQPNLSSRNKEDHRLDIIERLRSRASIQAVFQEHGQHRAMRDCGKLLMEDISIRDEMMEAMCAKPFDLVKAEVVLEKMKITIKGAPEMLKLRIEILPLILGGTISDYLQSTGELKRK